MDSIKHVGLRFDTANPESSALKLVLALYPNWDREDGEIEFVRFTDGITNTLLKAVKRRPNFSEKQINREAILLRAYGKGTEVLIDRDMELRSHSLLSKHGLAPPLLARFENGHIYKFIEGWVCSSGDLKTESVWRGVAQKLGQWHGTIPVAPDNCAPGLRDGKIIKDHRNSSSKSLASSAAINALMPDFPKPNLWTIMQKWIGALPSGTEDEISRRYQLQKELERSVMELGSLPGLGGNGLVFGHNDLLCGNIVVQPRKVVERAFTVETVSFIDYEYAMPVPAAFDLANHFAEWGGFACDYSVLPTRTQRVDFIKEYLKYYASSSGNRCSCELVTQLSEEVDRFRGIPGLYWGIWALIQSTISQIDFDYADYANTRLNEYWAWRAEEGGTREKDGAEMPLREKRWAEE